MSAGVEEPNAAAAKPPGGVTGKAAEYLEKQFSDSFKRELDQEENVVRSLPFFATSIGVLVAFVSLARTSLPRVAWEVWPLLVYGLLSGLLVSLAVLFLYLYRTTRQRTFEYPMSEAKVLEYASELTAYYRQTFGAAKATEDGDELDPTEAVERAVLDDVRSTLIGQIAAAAADCRANNWERLKARARAFIALMAALGFALALTVAILTRDALNGGPHGQDSQPRPGTADPHVPRPEDGASPGKAESARNADDRQGGVELRGSAPDGR